MATIQEIERALNALDRNPAGVDGATLRAAVAAAVADANQAFATATASDSEWTGVSLSQVSQLTRDKAALQDWGDTITDGVYPRASFFGKRSLFSRVYIDIFALADPFGQNPDLSFGTALIDTLTHLPEILAEGAGYVEDLAGRAAGAAAAPFLGFLKGLAPLVIVLVVIVVVLVVGSRKLGVKLPGVAA